MTEDSGARSGRRRESSWLHLRGRPQPAAAKVDLNTATVGQLVESLSLTRAQSDRIVSVRRKEAIRDVGHLAEIVKLNTEQVRRVREQAIGLIRPEVVILDARPTEDEVFSDRRWSIDVSFLDPNGGHVVLVSCTVSWIGSPIVVQQEVPAEAGGEVQVVFDEEQSLPPGPAEITVTAYDSLGGADSRRLPIWVLPSNPLSLFLSPGGRSIYNGSVRPDWDNPNWVTGLDITFLNGDAVSTSLQRGVTWRFWDGGVGGTLVESGSFNWPHTITVPAGGRYDGWVSFTSPPGSGIHDRYEDLEDMTIELVFNRTSGGSISDTITCRVMAGWGLNIIDVGPMSSAEETTISNGVFDARDVYEDHGLTFSSIQWWEISSPGGYRMLGSEGEWEDLLDDWTVDNSSVDCFVVAGMWDSFAGYSPTPGPNGKDGDCENDGLAVTISLVCFAHELGHYMGGLCHPNQSGCSESNSLGNSNVMFSTCGGRDFLYSQYQDFFGHPWTRIVR